MLVLAVLGVGLALWVSGTDRLYASARWVGYSVCHQLPSHSYTAWGIPLPLCARCTGQYLGALVMLGFMVWMGGARVRRFPSKGALAVLAALLLAWGVDGVNSYLDFLGLPHVYRPHNFVRLLTGMGEGMALMAVLWPLFAQATWPPERSVRLEGRDLPLVGGLALGVALLVHFGDARVRYTLGLLSAFGVLVLMSMIFSVFLRALTRRLGRNASRWELALFLGGGLLMALGLIAGVGTLRDLLPQVVE